MLRDCLVNRFRSEAGYRVALSRRRSRVRVPSESLLFITKTVKKSEQSNGFESTERQLINFLRF